MSESTADAVRQYVADGGVLISTYITSLYDETGVQRNNFLLSDVFGVDFAGYSNYSIGYLDRFSTPIDGMLPEIPLLFKDSGYQQPGNSRPLSCNVHEATEVYATITDPLIETDWSRQYHIFHDHAPQGKRTDRPGLVIHRFGAGISIYLALPILESYACKPNPWYRNLFRGMLTIGGVLPGPVEVEGSNGIRVVATRKDGDWIVHLVQMQQETGGILIDDYGYYETVCHLDPDFVVSGLEDAVSGSSIQYSTETDGRIRFQVFVKDYMIVRIVGG